MAEAFIVKVKEGPVAEDGATDAGSILVLAQFRLGAGALEEVAAIEDVVAEVLVDGAVELVGSGFRDDVDDATSGTPSFWSIAVGLNSDFLDAFHVRLYTDGPDDAFVVVGTVDDPVVEAFVLSVDGESGGIGTAVVWTATAAKRVARTLIGAWNSSYELNEVATVEWKVLHSPCRYGRAYRGAVGLEERSACSYFNDSGFGTGTELDVVALAVTRFYCDVLGDRRLEAASLD